MSDLKNETAIGVKWETKTYIYICRNTTCK